VAIRPYAHVVLEWQYLYIATHSYVATMKYCSQVFRRNRTFGNQSNRCNICSYNQVLVALRYFVRCNICYCNQVLVALDYFVRCNVCSCNHVLVGLGFSVHCNSKICCNTTSNGCLRLIHGSNCNHPSTKRFRCN
jgi:hypothetical protein